MNSLRRWGAGRLVTNAAGQGSAKRAEVMASSEIGAPLRTENQFSNRTERRPARRMLTGTITLIAITLRPGNQAWVTVQRVVRRTPGLVGVMVHLATSFKSSNSLLRALWDYSFGGGLLAS